MVSISTLLLLSGLALFLVAGGGSLVAPALDQVREDITKAKGTVTEQVANIKNTLNRNRSNVV